MGWFWLLKVLQNLDYFVLWYSAMFRCGGGGGPDLWGIRGCCGRPDDKRRLCAGNCNHLSNMKLHIKSKIILTCLSPAAALQLVDEGKTLICRKLMSLVSYWSINWVLYFSSGTIIHQDLWLRESLQVRAMCSAAMKTKTHQLSFMGPLHLLNTHPGITLIPADRQTIITLIPAMALIYHFYFHH